MAHMAILPKHIVCLHSHLQKRVSCMTATLIQIMVAQRSGFRGLVRVPYKWLPEFGRLIA